MINLPSSFHSFIKKVFKVTPPENNQIIEKIMIQKLELDFNSIGNDSSSFLPFVEGNESSYESIIVVVGGILSLLLCALCSTGMDWREVEEATGILEAAAAALSNRYLVQYCSTVQHCTTLPGTCTRFERTSTRTVRGSACSNKRNNSKQV